VRTLRSNGLIGSMGRTGACADNAAMESFFALLQRNVLDRQRWQMKDELRLAIVYWIERTYHRRRRQRVLGKLTPIEFALISLAGLVVMVLTGLLQFMCFAATKYYYLTSFWVKIASPVITAPSMSKPLSSGSTLVISLPFSATRV